MSLSIVHTPSNSGAASAVDIVAVHGLGGDAIATWTHQATGKFWLKDFLPQQIPDARILTFSYDAKAAFGRSTADIVDYAKSLLGSLVDKREEAEEQCRPLIFIAHSLGGIVVKQALLQATLEPRYQKIRDSTLGILFFGTPHRGSEKAVYGKVLASVAHATNSDVLLRLTSDFRFQLPAYHIVSFYEQRPMSIFSSLIVDKQSALLETAQEEQLPVDADHSAMCKFKTAESDIFEKTYKRIQRMRQSPLPATSQGTTTYNKYFNIPHLLSPVFTGQKDVCQRLEIALTPTSEPRQPVQRRFVLYGLGGSGKTQICIRYAQLYRERYWGIFWVDSSGHDSVQHAMAQIAPLIHTDPDIDSVKRGLTNTPQRWLLIFDNADDPDLPLSRYFPTGNRGHVIITSRNPECRSYSTVGHYGVGSMSPDDSLQLLLRTIYGSDSQADEYMTKGDGQQIVDMLDHTALAVCQAGAYIRSERCSPSAYLELYRQRRSSILNYLPTHGPTDYRYTIYATWQVSLDRIRSMPGAQASCANHLLGLLGFYHHEQIPLVMFCQAWNNTRNDTTKVGWSLWPESIPNLTALQQLISGSVTLLASFSLVKLGLHMTLSLHPLVHDWCRDSVTDREVHYRQAISLLAKSVKFRFETQDYVYRRSLVSHVQSCLQHYDQIHIDIDETVAEQLSVMAFILGESGLSRDAVRITEQVLRLQKSKLGNEHSDTMRSMLSLAMRCSEVGRHDEALKLFEQVVQLRKSKLGNEHLDTIDAMHSLANQYSEVGRQDKALRLAEQVVQLRKSKLGNEHSDTMRSMHSLALRYSEVGRQDKALKLSEQVVQLLRSKLGDEHPDTMMSMDSLANQYSEVGRQDEALTLWEQAVKLRKSRLGEEHLDTIASMYFLAVVYGEAGRRDEALKLSEQVLQLQKSKLGEDHPDTLLSIGLVVCLSKEEVVRHRRHKFSRFWKKPRS